MKAKIYDATGTVTAKSVTLSDEIFGIEPNNHAIYLDVKQHLANKRQGTHKSKERAEIAGSTRKIKKQKGTGGARAGSVKSGTRVGGGRIFGPRPRNYHFKLNIMKILIINFPSKTHILALPTKVSIPHTSPHSLHHANGSNPNWSYEGRYAR